MLIDESSEIEITSENLKFDFMNLQGLEMKDGGREMTVTATYTMQNSGDAQKVKMAFPLLGYLDYDYQKYADVLVDGAEVDYDFYFSESRYNAYVYNSGYAYLSLTMEDILSDTFFKSSLNNNPQGFLYSLTMPGPIDEFMPYVYVNNIVANDILKGTRIYTNLSEWTYTDDSTLAADDSIAAPLSTIYLFSTKELSISSNTFVKREGSSACLPDPIDIEWQVKGSNLEEFIDSALPGYIAQNESYTLPAEAYKALLCYEYEYLHTEIGPHDFIVHNFDHDYNWDSLVIDGIDRMMMFVYDVDFNAGETKTVQVKYAAEAIKNSEHYITDIYKIIYVSNPAQYWKSFKDLTVEVITDSYIVDSNISFTKEDGKYVAFLEQLPYDNIIFHLSDVENVQHKSHSSYCNSRIYGLTGFFITVTLIGMIFIRRNKGQI
jgi:hypothetical protein